MKTQQESYDQVEGSSFRQSFITHQNPNICIRILKTIDIFSFIPVPKDDAVSTKQSLIGTALFFLLFLSYIIYDFVQFAINNPPIEQNYQTSLDEQAYVLPNFAVAFMQGTDLNITRKYDDVFNYTFEQILKSQGSQTSSVIGNAIIDSTNSQNYLPWMSQTTKNFYSILRAPTQDLLAKGLLYSSDQTIYSRLKISFCDPNAPGALCNTTDEYARLSASGRMFLFIENIPDQSSISRETSQKNGNDYLLYNFFIVPGFYKRVIVQYRVVKTQILPDYLRRWQKQFNTRIEVDMIYEQTSNVSYFSTSGLNNQPALSFSMQLSPLILNSRISFSTLLDHVSMWGAFWGVLFALFALLFLGYNRKKFYKKNPDWDQFKKVIKVSEADKQDEKEK